MMYAIPYYSVIVLSVFLSFSVQAKVFEYEIENVTIPVDYDFTGNTLRLYGATDLKGTIVIEIVGRKEKFILRRKEKVSSLFWIDNKVAEIDNLPNYYAFLSSAPVDMDKYSQDVYKTMGLNASDYTIDKGASLLENNVIIRQVVDIKTTQKRFVRNEDGVNRIGKYLFDATLHFSDDVPIGHYIVKAYVLSDGKIYNLSTQSFYIGRSGIIKFIYKLARDYPALYGILMIIISLGIGLTLGRRKG